MAGVASMAGAWFMYTGRCGRVASAWFMRTPAAALRSVLGQSTKALIVMNVSN